MKHTLRKLCSSVGDYEATPWTRLSIDLGLLEKEFLSRGLIEVSVIYPILHVLFEEEMVVAKIYTNGKVLLEANDRPAAEKVAAMIFDIMDEMIGDST